MVLLGNSSFVNIAFLPFHSVFRNHTRIPFASNELSPIFALTHFDKMINSSQNGCWVSTPGSVLRHEVLKSRLHYLKLLRERNRKMQRHNKGQINLEKSEATVLTIS